MTRALRHILLVGAVGLALPACASAATYSAGRLIYVVKNAPATAGTQSSKSARCPAGTEVTGGGAFTSGTTVDDEVATSAPFDGGDRDAHPDDGWLAEINSEAAQGHVMTVYAICAPFSNLRYAHVKASVDPNVGRTVHVACPQGTRPVGGGAQTSSASTAIALRQTFPWQRPLSDMDFEGWQGTANNLSASPKKVAVYAICRHVTTGANYNYTGSFSGATPLLQSSDTTPACTGGLHASGGGAFIKAGLQGDLASTAPLDTAGDVDAAPDDDWTSRFNNETGTTQVQNGTVQFCVK